MTAREALHELIDHLSDEEIERLVALLRAGGVRPDPNGTASNETPAWIEARDYPALAAAWDNEDDRIFDEL